MHLHRIQLPTASRPLIPNSQSRTCRPVHIAQQQRVSIVTPSWKAPHTSSPNAELTKHQQTGSPTDLSTAPAPAITSSSTSPQLASLALTEGHRESLLLSYAAAGAAGAFGEYQSSMLMLHTQRQSITTHGPLIWSRKEKENKHKSVILGIPHNPTQNYNSSLFT